ncbi:Zn finger-containing GTPase- Activating Protein for ARF [Microbotryomycetes sp. JL221]|nr:Zn finger-containing GTPase- Activating Protein for ARF [Microbotryomycetes sp. JL221]
MTSEYDTKAVLLEWMKQGENSKCFECNIPSPQWCSLSYGTYLCLSCSGVHRSLGVHSAQIKRMEVGGNKKCREFFEASPEYDRNMSMPDKYATHFAHMYRDKLLAEAEGRTWSPQDTPVTAGANSQASTSSSSNATRNSNFRNSGNKPRLMTGGLTGGRASPALSSPASRSESPTYNQPASATSQKSANENYFARLGAANDSRPDHIPPSQGGKYGGFGSADPVTSNGASSYNSERLSSRALPSFEDIREDPASAVSKGWGLFSAALGAVGKTVNEFSRFASVLQPTLEKAGDPNLQSQLASYVTRGVSVIGDGARQGGQLLSSGLHSGSEYLKRDMGLDVGDLGAGYLDRATGRGRGQGYGYVGSDAPTAYDSREATLGETADEFFAREMGGDHSSRDYEDDSPRERFGNNGSKAGSATSTSRGISRQSSGSHVPTIPAPRVPADEDAWAKLAPQSAARATKTQTPTPSSRPSSAMSGSDQISTSAGAMAPASNKKKDDDWDEFDDASW